jgi:hypothetical protein
LRARRSQSTKEKPPKNSNARVCQRTYKTNKNSSDDSNHWRIPSSWKVIVVGDKIKLWQVYADNSVVIDIVNKNR